MKTAAHYEHKSTGYGIGHTRLRRILELAGDVKGKRIIDAGCARGYLGAQFRERGAYVVGLDISSEVVAQAREKLDEAYPADLEETWPRELAENTFDMVVLAETLEHVFDPVAVLKQAHRVLKPGGSVLITTPNFLTWTNRIGFLFGNFRYRSEGMFDFGHIRWFTYPYLRQVLRESGFVVVKERHIIFPGKLTRLLKRWPSVFAWQFIVKAEKI